MRRLFFLLTTVFLVAGCAAATTSSPPAPTRTEGPADSEPVEEDEPGFIEICVVKKTLVRVDYRGCDDVRPGLRWYYLPENGSFHGPYTEAYRARRSGGDAAKAAIDYDDPDATEEEAEPEEETCTTTINGECVATNRCTETTNGVCTTTEDGYLGNTSRDCRHVFTRKRWIRRCY